MQVRRRQFPLRLAYGITCNKAQGKTLTRAALDLSTPPFAHGQLHVPVGRVSRRTDLRILVGDNMIRTDEEGDYVTTVNVVEPCALEASMPPHVRAEFLAAFPALP